MNGLKNSLNQIREISSTIYHQYVPIIEEDTDISAIATPILTVPEVYNEFYNALINRIVYTQFNTKTFRNPFTVLEGDNMPLGYAGQEIYVNPAKGRQYNPNDFAGLLVKYEADVKVQYTNINMDVQYPVTFSRQDLKKAFVSWNDLERFIDNLSNSLYNGAYIDQFNAVKQMVAGAYKGNTAIIEQITAPTTEATAKAFIVRARELFLNFQTPNSEFNAWHKVGGSGRPIVTWSNPDDIVFIITNSIRAYLDVEVLAQAFNMDKATLLGNIMTVDNFNIYNEDGSLNFDGSGILGIIADKSWFKIKKQDEFMDSFYNPNNRSIQYYLNVIKMYNVSLFANGVILATSTPTVTITGIEYEQSTVNVPVGETVALRIKVNPVGGNSPSITYTSSDTDIFTGVASVDDANTVLITGVANGTETLTATCGNLTATVTIKVGTGVEDVTPEP